MATQDVPSAQPDAKLVFEAQLAVNRGWRPIDRNSRLTITCRKLTLSTSNGRLNLEVPVSEVSVEPARFSAGAAAKITVGGETYSLTPRALTTYNAAELTGASMRLGASAPLELAGSALKLAGDISKLKRGKEMTFTMMRAIKKAGGQVSFG